MSLRAALLTMIGNAPRSGYELKASFDGSLGFVWQATHQQIYQELKRLVSDGLARVQEAPARGRQVKKVYSLTPAGASALREWLDRGDLSARRQEPLLIKFFAAERVDVARLRDDLARARERAGAARERLESIERGFAGAHPEGLPIGPRLAWLALLAGLPHAQSTIAWFYECERCLPAPPNAR